MRLNLLALAAASTLAGLTRVAALDDVWFLDFPQPIAREQLDPIVNPNAQSSHMHRIFGELS